MVSFDVTRSALASDGTYTTSTIKGSVQQGGGNVAGVPGTWAKYAHTLFTSAVIVEGDRVTDAFTNLYDVHHCAPYCEGDNFEHYICELVKLEAFTLKTLTLGTADSITGIYPSSYTSATIYGNLSPKGQTVISAASGYYSRYDYTFVSAADILEGDIIVDADNTEYEVKQVQNFKSSRVDFAFYWKICGCIKRSFSVQPATSGTWHLDSNSVKTDPRNRIKVLLDTSITAANIKKDNGSTNASTITCFDKATYPVTRIFTTKAIDAVAVISCAPSEPKERHAISRIPIGYDENVTVTLEAVNKTGVTATNLLEQFEQEIRHVLTDNPTLRIKHYMGSRPEYVDLGYGYIYQLIINIRYERFNDDLTPTYPTVTYGTSQGTTYIIPNITYFDIEPITNNKRLDSIGRIGSHLQKFGAPDYTITIKANLDLEPWSGLASDTKISWKRPQTNGTKTDTIPEQVFFDIYFNGLSAEVYQNLNLGWGATIPVTLEKPQVTHTGDTHEVTLTFKAYSASAASAYKTWFGIS